MDERTISATERTIGYLLRLPYERLSERVYGGLAAQGFPDIRPAHSAVLRHIAGSGSRVSDLAERAGLTKQSMAYLVEALAAAGYVSVAPDPADGRAKLVRLTRRGHAVSETLVRLSREVEADFAARLAPGQMATLRGLLGELADALERP
ncbi:MarR family transcriptional regulator [Belnapia sp. T6]|uniref:MarR family transcriptional regulator n=1 Tax=Belnapia mucosa TaxID=2804532 RepID=A0ABS1VDQ9_9PROT|nr:MarR family transcriptional regulator [Belnapia mucosa]MBL6459276.1 MarR family transcriptional regulator [Belnapia mucosa]